MQVIRWSPETHLNVVLIDRGIHSHIEYGFGARGIAKIDRASLQYVAIARKDQISAAQVHSPQQHWLRGSTMNLQVGVPCDAQSTTRQIQTSRRSNTNL